MGTPLTSRIVEVPAWRLPQSVEIADGFVRWQVQEPLREVASYGSARSTVDASRAELAGLRRSIGLVFRHGGEADGVTMQALRARRGALLATIRRARDEALEKRIGMKDAFRTRQKAARVRDPSSPAHRRLSARDEYRVRQVAGANADPAACSAAIRSLFLESGILAPMSYWPGRAVPVSLVCALAASFTATQDVVDALTRGTLSRSVVVDAARALARLDKFRTSALDATGRVVVRAVGERLPEALGASSGLLYPRDYQRNHSRVGSHAQRVITNTVTVWLRLFFAPVEASWHGDGLAISTANAGLGAALAANLLHQPGAGSARFTCEGCDVRFEYRPGERVARTGAPVFCPRCRKNGTSGTRAARREAVVQCIQTRLAWGWDIGRIRSELGSRLAEDDRFDDLLARAQKRRKRR